MKNEEIAHIDLLIVRSLEGSAEEDELLQLQEWLSLSEDNRSHYLKMKNLWEISAGLDIDTGKALDKVLGRIGKAKKKVGLLPFLTRAAAVLFIPLLATTLWLAAGKFGKSAETIGSHRVDAAFGSVSTFHLPDGSTVWLNSGSSLVYPERFGNGTRTVQLSGEAYFEVSSDKDHPFLVNTGHFTVKATGTRFNVMAYGDCPSPSVTLVEGKVAVWSDRAGNRQDEAAVLRPNQHLDMDRNTGRFSISAGDSYKYIAWKDGKLVFRDDPLSEVARRISLQYNVEIEITDKLIGSYRYRATFENEPLSELLRLLKISAPIDYREEGPKSNADGTFTRRKIIIFPTTK
ncbi:MAG: FecR family protein [Bacteroidota bacterium]